MITQEQVEWLKENYPKGTQQETYNKFIGKFGNVIKYNNYRDLCSNRLKLRVKKIWFSQEMFEYASELLDQDNITWDKVAQMVNEKFGTTIKGGSIHTLMTRLGNTKSPKSSRTNGYGDILSYSHPIGYEFKDNKGDTHIKINNIPSGDKENYMLKSRYVWEQNFGKIPQEKVVGFLDGNKDNFDPSNLFLYDKKDSIKLNGGRWKPSAYGKGNITLAMLSIIETERIIKDKLKENVKNVQENLIVHLVR